MDSSSSLGLSLIPLASFWATFNSLLSAAKFVNGIRDCVLTGVRDSTPLSRQVRRAMRFDWYLAMAGTILASFLFAGLLLWMGAAIEDRNEPGLAWAVRVVGFFPGLGGVLFIACGVNDARAMARAIADDATRESATV